jgi:hypothetical protein
VHGALHQVAHTVDATTARHGVGHGHTHAVKSFLWERTLKMRRVVLRIFFVYTRSYAKYIIVPNFNFSC